MSTEDWKKKNVKRYCLKLYRKSEGDVIEDLDKHKRPTAFLKNLVKSMMRDNEGVILRWSEMLEETRKDFPEVVGDVLRIRGADETADLSPIQPGEVRSFPKWHNVLFNDTDRVIQIKTPDDAEGTK